MNTPIRLRDDLRYIVVEGVIGAGKTTLARLLADALGGRLVLEKVEENPFLEFFYEDRERWAFQTQLNYLVSRFHQQKALAERDLFHQVIVSDYAFDKDRIFAHVNLDGGELQLYESLYKVMEPNAPVPDLLVYLQSTPERLLKNIAKRARAYEAGMDPGYLAELNDAYNYYLARYTKSPLLIVNAAEMDFVANVQERQALLHEITAVQHQGTVYFNPSRSEAT